MKQQHPIKLDHYCRTFHCLMNREACLARQSLAISKWHFPINERLELVSSGFYSECRDCPSGRWVAQQKGVNLKSLRLRSSSRRSRIEERDWAISYEVHPYSP